MVRHGEAGILTARARVGVTMRKTRQRREALMAADPHCHWCGTPVIYYTLSPREKVPSNFATIDHLNSRASGPRPADGETVLACNSCNQRRGYLEEQAQGIEVLRERSLRFPGRDGQD